MIPQHTIEQVRDRTDVVEIVGQYVDLKRAGTNYKGLCPFHQERTPSFIVSPERQTFHCFGCGKGGNVFRFLMEMDGVTFPEALPYGPPAVQQTKEFLDKSLRLRYSHCAASYSPLAIEGVAYSHIGGLRWLVSSFSCLSSVS